ncbi:MAG: hypothetical protein NFW16_10720 [Candidatus Accumulibacter sp.]|uniref:hypothetical protein n=1 Tax=Accumulibacter sp. TaxID=2053492 RepID=UPI002588ED37|nr:hypothetical protein [Accumulibacter sp.]MCM8622181.1 hypothetical protein [Accumulibacter sp.]
MSRSLALSAHAPHFRSMKKIVIVGFGRMGISHAAIISGILGDDALAVTVVDPSIGSRLVARFLFPQARIARPESFLRLIRNGETFDYALLTTPPMHRQVFLDALRAGRAKLFVEKPVLTLLRPGEMSGYVLQHSPLNGKLKAILTGKKIAHVRGSLVTNLDFGSARGWRASRYGTVLHEFGGHVLSVLGAVLPDARVFGTPLANSDLSVRRAERNHVDFDFSFGDIDFTIELVAASHLVRKASYSFEFAVGSDVIQYDLYSIRSQSTGSELANVAASGAATRFYVRGFEFSRQMDAFLSGEGDILSSAQINNFENILMAVGG